VNKMAFSIKEEKLVQLSLTGLTQADCYRKVYPGRASRGQPKTLHEKASRVFRSGKVKARLAKLEAAAQEATGFTAEFVLKQSGEAFDRLKAEGNLRDARGYLELLGKHRLVKAFDTTITLELPPKVYRNFLGRKKAG